MTGTDLALTVAILSTLVVAVAIIVAVCVEVRRAWRFRQLRRFAEQQWREDVRRAQGYR
jgi:HAMP domain-containing protein